MLISVRNCFWHLDKMAHSSQCKNHYLYHLFSVVEHGVHKGKVGFHVEACQTWCGEYQNGMVLIETYGFRYVDPRSLGNRNATSLTDQIYWGDAEIPIIWMSDGSVESLPQEFVRVFERGEHGFNMRIRVNAPDYNEDSEPEESDPESVINISSDSDEDVNMDDDVSITDVVRGIRFPLYGRDEYILAQRNIRAYKAQVNRECNAQLRYISNALVHYPDREE